ncbi:uncharacterized protein ATNIH1004_002544 [Aspergillus tanneri]|nr:uncharacterized protein ATNIH1004_002544 [Aspergillus tanneri]KAA8649865.1 hypothetical protein ATNIH1004_002544 [Aspergillus tanneri]
MMQPSKGPESPDLGRTVSRSRSRSNSISSDSQLPRLHLLVPPPVNPAPCFIASSAAAQIVTADQEFNAADFVADDNDDNSRASAFVTSEALSALNGFLDHLLFNILAVSKSTQLAYIRPAVAEVLKPRLAKEVVTAADEELSEYIGGPEDEQFGGQPTGGEFDLIRSWKLTRLRCMVYTRLGDMEEEDEEEYIAQDGLSEDENMPRRFSSHVGYITPAAAIFLASIIEYIGEQALVIAGETARSRLSSKLDDDGERGSGAERGTMDRLVVGDLDVERLALNPTLGRLWRTWRKRTRNPNLARATSRESIRRRGTVGHLATRRSSSVATDERSSRSLPPPILQIPTEVDPASIALPMSEYDVQEIEQPDFTSDVEGDVGQTMQAVLAHKVRPKSLMVLSLPSPRSSTSSSSSPVSPRPQSLKSPRHVRSRSLPDASHPQEATTTKVNQVADRPSPTLSEERHQLETMYEHDEDGEPVAEKKSSIVESLVQPRPEDQSPTKRSETDSLPEEPTGQDTAATSSLSAASVEIVISQTNSTRASSLSDRIPPDSESEVIEGQGVCEKPKLASVQRRKRKSCGEPTDGSNVADGRSNDQVVPTEAPPQTQGDSATAQSTVSPDAPKKSDTAQSSAESFTPQTRTSTDNASLEKTPRPASSSAESANSERSRARHKPSPLSLGGGSHHRYGCSSPPVSSSSSATERAAVQRLSGRPSTSAASSSYPKPRRSDSVSSSRDRRPVTAGSTTSQVSTKLKGLIVRQGESGSGSVRVRSSSETSRESGVTGDTFFGEKTGLDELIRSEETLHYTLTPRSMREIEEPDSPRWRTKRSSTAELADFLRNTAPPGDELARTRVANTSALPRSKSSELPKHKPIQTLNMNLPQKPSVKPSRDAKPSTGSTGDFANLIKSGGPSSPVNMKSRIHRLSDATEISKKFPWPQSSLSNNTQSNTSPTTASRLQARPAVAPKGDQSSDLIDFIREGPPSAGGRRIPRAVAPFRDTIDEDDLQFLELGNSEYKTPSISSTQDESIARKSITSVGSRTGLLESTGRPTTQSSAMKQAPKSAPDVAGPSDNVRPMRKQRRVPDPYAIDSDDDDDLEFLEGPKPKREEESLIDFLRNVPPPSETETTPQSFTTHMASVQSPGLGGMSSMKARLREKIPSAKPSGSSLRQQPEASHAVGSSNYSARVGMERNGSYHSYSLPSFSERQTETSALADFLRSTGPIESPAAHSPSSPQENRGKDSTSNSFSRLFVRRKKVEV